MARDLFCFRLVREVILKMLPNSFGIRSDGKYLRPHRWVSQGGEPNLIYATQALYRVSDAAWNLLDPALAHHLPSETLVKKSLPELPQVSEYGGKLFGSTKNDK